MFGVYFNYNGKDSSEYHLVMANMSSATADIPLSVSRDVLSGTLNRTRNAVNSMGTNFSDVLRFSVSLMHDECGGYDSVFTEDEVDEIAAWLTSPDYPLLFHMYDYAVEDGVQTDWYRKYDYFGVFTDIDTFVVHDRIYGLTATFTTNSPFAWTAEKTAKSTYAGENEPRTLTVRCTTSERNREVYPLIKIEPALTQELGTQTVTITQVTDKNRVLQVSVNPADTTFLDCRKCRIYNESGTLSYEDLGISDYSEIYWPKLYYGNNTITIEGKADVTFSWREPRKVGAY